jgi:hypothetical protein
VWAYVTASGGANLRAVPELSGRAGGGECGGAAQRVKACTRRSYLLLPSISPVRLFRLTSIGLIGREQKVVGIGTTRLTWT